MKFANYNRKQKNWKKKNPILNKILKIHGKKKIMLGIQMTHFKENMMNVIQ